MTPKILALSAAAAALVVGGCSSTRPTPPPPPEPSPLNYNALTVDAGGSTQRHTGATVQGNENNARVVVDGTTYTFSGGRTEGTYEGITTYSYQSGNIVDPNGAAILVGGHAGAAIIADNVNNRGVFVVGGQPTTPGQMPRQLVNYDGIWTMIDSSSGQTQGVFQADVDFNSRQFDIDLRNGNNSLTYGSASGRVQGTGFTGELTTNAQSGLPSQNTVNGQFYGPNAQDMAGLINGRATDNNAHTAGVLIGTR